MKYRLIIPHVWFKKRLEKFLGNLINDYRLTVWGPERYLISERISISNSWNKDSAIVTIEADPNTVIDLLYEIEFKYPKAYSGWWLN